MKKALNLKITLCIFAIIYAILITALMLFFKGEIKTSWFALFLTFAGLYLIKKAFLMNSDSSLWLGVFCILSGFALVLVIYVPVFNEQLILLLSICVAFASFVVFLTWLNKVHLYLFVTTILGVVPSGLYAFKLIGFWWFVALVVLINILNFLIFKLFIIIFAKKEIKG